MYYIKCRNLGDWLLASGPKKRRKHAKTGSKSKDKRRKTLLRNSSCRRFRFFPGMIQIYKNTNEGTYMFIFQPCFRLPTGPSVKRRHHQLLLARAAPALRQQLRSRVQQGTGLRHRPLAYPQRD